MRNKRRKKDLTIFVSTVLATMLLSLGCGRAPINSYYTLNNRKTTGGTIKDAACDRPLGVTSVVVSPPYDLRKIVFRPDSLEIRYYSARYWASPPEDMINKLVTRRLETSRLFSQVDSEMNISRPHMTLTVKLHAIEEVDIKNSWNAHLAMGFMLVDEETDSVLWRHEFDVTRKVEKKDIKTVIAALNDIFNAEMDKAFLSLRNVLSQPNVCKPASRGYRYDDNDYPPPPPPPPEDDKAPLPETTDK